MIIHEAIITLIGSHIDQSLPKLSAACFAVRRLFQVLNIRLNIYITYGVIFWCNFTVIGHVFLLQKIIVRIMAGVESRSSCRALFKKFYILPVPWQYIFSLVMFVVNNLESFQTDLSTHTVDTSNKTLLHRAVTNILCIQKGVPYAGIKISTSLPSGVLKLRSGEFHFKTALCKHRISHSFYTSA